MKLCIKRVVMFSSIFFASAIISAAHIARKAKIQIRTIQEAIAQVHKAIEDFPANSAAIPIYEKEQSDSLIRCAKILYDNARTQLLEALSEIDNRIAYWQYQKDHPWNYFVSKNPMKWVTGPKQEDEIEDNIETLKSHQGELYVLLGQLSEQGAVFTRGYKDTFITDYMQGYEWVDKLLDMLVRIKTKGVASETLFIARAQQLQLKLENVTHFKDDILSDISETAIPSYFERNWLKGGTLLLGLGYGYTNLYDQIKGTLLYGQENVGYIINPVLETVKDVVNPGWRESLITGGAISAIDLSYKSKLELARDYLSEMGKKYALEEAAAQALEKLLIKDYLSYEKFVEEIGKRELSSLSLMKPNVSIQMTQEWINAMKDYARGLVLGGKLEGVQYGHELVRYIHEREKQFSGVGKLVLLIPAVLAMGGSYLVYQKLTAKNYSPLRRALVEINSLFVDQLKPLTDEQYGKMVYLIYILKQRAEKELPTKKNMRADFMHDLERIESPEFSVASKRAIVEDMFKKYYFLGLIQKK